MRALLVKPKPQAVQFGLAPFFKTEPLGLEYLATAAKQAGHQVRIADMRFERAGIRQILAGTAPEIVGLSCLHVLDVPSIVEMASEIKQCDPSVPVLVGGHSASAFPEPLMTCRSIDAICLGEGERTFPAVMNALSQGVPLEDVPSLMLRDKAGHFSDTSGRQELIDLAGESSVPDRAQVKKYEKDYCCLNYAPVWTLETTRGCPHRCKFCSVWQLYRGTFRFHRPEDVRLDFESAGHNVFVIDDIFWVDRDQSSALAQALLSSGERKNWMLVQSRLDLVAGNSALLQEWRPLARDFDIFFGFESPTSRGLKNLNKGFDPQATAEGIRVARELGFGVTGNFIIDPDSTESDFEELWAFLREHNLSRVGFTILTPLPGTQYFNSMRDQLLVWDWNHYDLHHLLWRPRLPIRKFFELYCETWRRSVLHMGSQKKWWHWLRGISPLQIPRLARILARTQKLMDPQAYLDETKVPRMPLPEEREEDLTPLVRNGCER
jgi:radical SAM superfamily enzyme YgiQ (UPF0313 family)